MPLFVTLTYDDEHLPYKVDGQYFSFKEWCDDCRGAAFDELVPTLRQSDVSKFIKRLKDRYNLYDTDFSYFGCGEYGDTFERPHYHVLFFGLDDFYHRWLNDSHEVENELAGVWQNGIVDVKVAEWSGIHYVTKYTLKQMTEEGNYPFPPFCFNSHGLGLPWLFTPEAVHVRATYDVRSYYQRLNSMMLQLDFSSTQDIYYSANAIVKYLEPYVPKLYCTVPSGRKCRLPRYLRSKLYSSAEHFKDHPFWFYDSIVKLRDATKYYLDNGAADADRVLTQAQENAKNHAYKIVNYMKRKTKNRKRI